MAGNTNKKQNKKQAASKFVKKPGKEAKQLSKAPKAAAPTKQSKQSKPTGAKGGSIGGFIKKVFGTNSAQTQSVTKASAKQSKPGTSGKPENKGAKMPVTKIESKSDKKKSSPKSFDSKGSRAGASESVAHGSVICREVACELMSTTGGYCRMHYIKNWKKIKRKEMILKEKKLNSYIEELVSKYPDKYIEAIRQDLASEKDFSKVIADLEIDESLDDFESVETESAEGIIDNLKRDFEDDGDVF